MSTPAPALSDGYDGMLTLAADEQRELVLVERREQYATLTMSQPEALNPLSVPLTVQLHRHLQALLSDTSVKAIVLTGCDPAFSAGGDLRAMTSVAHPAVDNSPEGATAMWRWIRYQFSAITRLIVRSDKLFVAAVNGPAAGVGLAFAMACDLVIASDRARLVTAFGRIGLVPEVGLGWLLTRRLGYHKTLELYIDGTVLTADQALQMGLVNEVVPHETLLARAGEWCEKAASLPRDAMAITKPLLRSVADLSWEQAITMEELTEPMCFTTDDPRRAVKDLLAHDSSSSR